MTPRSSSLTGLGGLGRGEGGGRAGEEGSDGKLHLRVLDMRPRGFMANWIRFGTRFVQCGLSSYAL